MDKLKRFYRGYTIFAVILSAFVRNVVGPNGTSYSETIFMFFVFMAFPILFYGTFIFFPKRFFGKINSSTRGERIFKILYFLALLVFIFYVLVATK